MTKEEKDLLFRDLCARLPYNPMIKVDGNPDPFRLDIRTRWILNYGVEGTLDELFYDVKPYLRPMSDMTEEENWDLCYQDQDDIWGKCKFNEISEWCDSRFLDHRGLIERNLAIPAPKGMYTV